jgi:hypothetical protein
MLQETIEQAYRIFKYYPAIRPLDVCTDCCMDPADEERLAIMAVRHIPHSLLMEYNDEAKPAKTRIEEVKHFLPRYFELIADFQFPSHSTELSFSRLAPFDKQEWTADELQLLRDFSIAFFKKCLSVYPIAFMERIDAILVMFWNAGFDIDPLLAIWEKNDSVNAVLHFKDLYFHGFVQHNRTKMYSPFGTDEQATKLIEWLEGKNVQAFFAGSIEQILLGENQLETDVLNELELLYDILRSGSSSSYT